MFYLFLAKEQNINALCFLYAARIKRLVKKCTELIIIAITFVRIKVYFQSRNINKLKWKKLLYLASHSDCVFQGVFYG